MPVSLAVGPFGAFNFCFESRGPGQDLGAGRGLAHQCGLGPNPPEDYCGIRPQLEPLPIGSQAESATTDAILVIGDRALRGWATSSSKFGIWANMVASYRLAICLCDVGRATKRTTWRNWRWSGGGSRCRPGRSQADRRRPGATVRSYLRSVPRVLREVLVLHARSEPTAGP